MDRNVEERPRGRFRLMHCTMVMLALLFVSKVTEVVTGMHDLLAVRQAEASSAKKEAPEESGHAEAESDGGHGGGDEKKQVEMTEGEGKSTVEEMNALKNLPVGQHYTQSELDLLQNLAKRRDELDAREKELQLKSKVLEAAEARIDAKVKEMKELQTELAKVVATYNEHQDNEIKSLVKIYESMKPLDAAAIFNEMEMPILLEVIDKMSERKVAPILAGMDPRRARDVTQELAEMRRGRSRLGSAATGAGAP